MTAPNSIERQLSLARQGLTPSAELRVRVRARFGASEPAPPVPSRAGSRLEERWRALRASGNLGLAVGAGVFGLGCLVGLLGSALVRPPQHEAASREVLPDELAAPSPAPTAPPTRQPEPAALASAEPPAAPALAAPAPTAPAAPELATPARPAARPRERAPAADAARLESAPRRARRAAHPRDWRGELELLERAERAVRGDNVALALALLGDFDARYPDSRLVEERAAVETMAHCQAQATDSTARAGRFLNLYATSLYRTRVEALCEPRSPASPRPSDKTGSAGH
jgi:type IV secretory pathway VirB10-like protein